MRFFIKIVFKLMFGFIAITIGAFSFAPPTQGERQVLGSEPDRIELLQMRTANLMLAYAPEVAVVGFSNLTGVSPDQIRTGLELKATGNFPSESQLSANQSDSGRRVEAGGALFVSAD